MILVRDITPSDCDAVASIHVRSWQTAYKGIMSQDFLDQLDVVERAGRWRTNLSAGRCPINLLAEANNAVVGFGGGGHNRTPDLVPEATGELWALYADPNMWAKGIGSAIFNEFRKRWKTSFCVWAARDNRVGRSFYEKMGGTLLRATKNEEVGGATVPHVVYLFD